MEKTGPELCSRRCRACVPEARGHDPAALRRVAARMAARGLPPPRCSRTPEEQAAVDAQIERVRQMFGIPAGGKGLAPRVRDLTSVSAIAAAVINRAARY